MRSRDTVVPPLGREVMNPITVKVFHVDRVKCRFLDMYTTSGRGAGTAEVIITISNFRYKAFTGVWLFLSHLV